MFALPLGDNLNINIDAQVFRFPFSPDTKVQLLVSHSLDSRGHSCTKFAELKMVAGLEELRGYIQDILDEVRSIAV